METVQQLQPQKKTIYLPYFVIFVGYLVFGFSENIKGPAIPRIQADFAIDELQIGTLLAFNSLGFLLACSFTGVLTSKYGIKLASILAFGTMVLSGVLIYISNNYLFFSASYFLMYIGNGLLEIALAILAARVFTKNTGFMMNLSHFFYGLSSTAAPIMAAGLMGVNMFGNELGWRGMYFLMLALCIIPLIPAIYSKFPKDSAAVEEKIPLKVFLKDRAAWLITLILSLGVIAELSIAGWLVNFLEKSYHWSSTSSSVMLSVFFLCFMLGRLLLGFVTDKIGFMTSLIIFSAVAGVATIVATILGPAAIWLYAVAGFGIAPIYPTVMALLAKRYPNGIDAAISVTVTLMGIAVVIGNFLIGAIIDGSKDWFASIYGNEIGVVRGFQMGFIFIGVCALLCSIFSLYLHRYLSKRNEMM
ncbi:MFS transporter [Metabacillus niabensis]|uniref:Fucose permease n=1 Tax=Metabacillus niabensis TaxID=324854 RepID=A0ABT9YW37_9BACI|nr:MFS transporter [Metabacillus niabensis]MDQ0223807.1 fucose permease [Metabacillus niabensis]